MNKKASFIGQLATLVILIVFIYVCIKHPEILKEAASWAISIAKIGYNFIMEKIA